MLERIARAACPEPGATVLEIGPGRGALTRYLLPHAARVIAIEVDPRMVASLQRNFSDEPSFTLIHQDVLTTDLSQWGGPITVAGNLPYYITSPIVEKTLALGPLLQRAVFLVQKEVAERMAAIPGNRDYGYLSVQVQTFAEPQLLFTVPPAAFDPPPKVDSAVILLQPRPEPLVPDPAAFLTFVSRCFHQKRKTLRNNLRPYYNPDVVDGLPEAGQRAEQLSVAQLASLYERLRA